MKKEGNKKVWYCSIEGIDGVGKSTFIKNLNNYLASLGKKVLLTKEFGTELDPFCKRLREIALSDKTNISEMAGQILFASIAKQHQENIIRPNLNSSNYDVILSDRGMDSNFAYGPEHVKPEEKEVLLSLFKLYYENAASPDVTFLLDADSSFTKTRIDKRAKEVFKNGGIDRVEKKGVDFQARVRKNFLELAKNNADRIKVIKINSNTKPEDVLNEAIAILKKYKLIC